MNPLLSGRVSVVTGAGSGIGRGIAEGFAREGAVVVVADRSRERADDTVRLISHGGGSAFRYESDVTSEADMDRLATEVLAEHGSIDILINNVGAASAVPFEELSLEAWESTLRVNLTSMFIATQAVMPAMKDQGFGRIINIGSQLGSRGAANMCHYCAAKAGVLGFTRALAREVIAAGITVNAIAPGLTDTPALGEMPKTTLDAIKAELPIGRPAAIEEIVPTAILLASDAGSYYVGAIMNVSGGHVMT